MKLETIEVLVADDQQEAELLARVAVKFGVMRPWVKCIWRLTLPRNSGPMMKAVIAQAKINKIDGLKKKHDKDGCQDCAPFGIL